MKTVRFKHMWEGFDPFANPLLDVIRSASEEPVSVVSDSRAPVDLEVGSVYPDRRWLLSAYARAAMGRARGVPSDVRTAFTTPPPSPSARCSLWYTPENRRPPAEGWEYTLSFEADTWPRNAYFPFWMLNSDLLGPGDAGFLGEPLAIEQLCTRRVSSTGDRKRFCCAVFRNPDPVRLTAIKQLEKVGRIDIYGPYSGRPIPSKKEILSRYQFAICFENSLYPGYVTEKVFDAWVSGCVPIYWGLDAQASLNPQAILNLATMDGGLPELVQSVADLVTRRDLISEIAEAPILRARPDTDAVCNLIKRALAPQGASSRY